jgi:hypothetical protein
MPCLNLHQHDLSVLSLRFSGNGLRVLLRGDRYSNRGALRELHEPRYFARSDNLIGDQHIFDSTFTNAHASSTVAALIPAVNCSWPRGTHM